MVSVQIDTKEDHLMASNEICKLDILTKFKFNVVI